jgi:PAS domain S-box-containing protein
VDRNFCLAYAVEPEAVLGRPFGSLHTAEDAGEMQAALSQLGPDAIAAFAEVRRPGDERERRWLRWTLRGQFDAGGRLVEIDAFASDVTHERKVEADSARLAAIVAGADDAIVSKTLEGIVTSWNPGAEAMFGFSASEAVGRSIALIIPKERLHEETEILARVQRGERTEHFETQRLHKDGHSLTVSVNVSPVHDSAGRIIGASKIARDISEQRRAQERLRASVRGLEALYRLADMAAQANGREDVFEAALEAITSSMGTLRASVLIFDSAGAVRFTAWRGLSERYRRAMVGHSPWERETTEPLPVLVEDVLSDPSVQSLRDEITREGIRSLAFIPLVFQDRLLGKFMVYFDVVRRFTSDEVRLCETIARHVGFGLARVDAEAAAQEALGRERAAREEADIARGEAETASRTKDEFLAMLAHELRNPLGAIVHAAALLAGHRTMPAELGASVAILERQSQHLARLLDDLLDVARIASGHIEMSRETLDLRDVVSQALESQALLITSKEQQVQVCLPGSPVVVTGDPVRLQQVLGNLLNNASKYTPARGSVRVALGTEGAEAHLSIQDTGAGIPPDRLEDVFDLFVQANPTLARTEGGLGVGLTLVRRVIELHQGRVKGHSEGLGKGSEFSVHLPLAAAEAQREPVESPKPPLTVGSQKILVVDDHPDGREALAALLRLQGHEAHEAGSGGEALALAEKLRPQVVLLDIGLPDLDGYEVGRSLRQSLGSQVHLIALTGYGQPSDRVRSGKAGFDAHLTKPVDVKTILETLASLIA